VEHPDSTVATSGSHLQAKETASVPDNHTGPGMHLLIWFLAWITPAAIIGLSAINYKTRRQSSTGVYTYYTNQWRHHESHDHLLRALKLPAARYQFGSDTEGPIRR
jgi:hypothetical protein